MIFTAGIKNWKNGYLNKYTASERRLYHKRQTPLQMNKEKLFSSLSIKIAFAVVILIVSLFVFVFLAHWMVVKNEDIFDEWVFEELQPYINGPMKKLMAFFTFFGKPDFLVPAYIFVILYYLLKGKKNLALNIFIIGSTSTGWLFLLKQIFQRPRPNFPVLQNLDGYSFPSGHAFLFFVFISIFVFLNFQGKYAAWIKWTIAFGLFAFSFFVGCSRIFLRYHYASDVIAGFCMGFAYVTCFLFFSSMFNNSIRS